MLKDLRAAPNLLTFLRLFIIPFLVTAILDAHYRTAFALFLLAGFSDGLDGLLARWLKQRTLLGQYLDPVADKLLLSTLFLVLMHQGLIPRRVTILVFSRDIGMLVVAALLFAAVGTRDFRPSIWGKANTAAQVFALTMTLWAAFYPESVLLFAKKWSLVATFVLTLFSWLHYTLRETRRMGSQATHRLPADR
ncbi:MAG: CDP-alcohol phosphatidyltransferase family protein [Acidobacteriaceae bacterium]